MTAIGSHGKRVGRRHTYTPAVGQLILEFLGDGSAPFIAIAAERAGIQRGRAHDWIRQGELPGCAHEELVEFAQSVRRIRANWMAAVSREIMSATMQERESARQKAWLLERVERDLFDVHARHAPKPRDPKPIDMPEGVHEKDEREVLSELERPETPPH